MFLKYLGWKKMEIYSKIQFNLGLTYLPKQKTSKFVERISNVFMILKFHGFQEI